MKNILLIEDEDNLNRGISLKLQKEGYTVFSAATVAEGLSLFQANTIDLVICDIGLPDGNGLDLCASIRQKSDVLFLFLTALDTEVDMITGYEMGADDYVTKPFSMSVLISKISAMLKRTEKTISNVVQTGELTFYINEKRVRFLYKGIIIKHNKTEPTYTKTSLFLCEKRRFFMARTEKGVVATI